MPLPSTTILTPPLTGSMGKKGGATFLCSSQRARLAGGRVFSGAAGGGRGRPLPPLVLAGWLLWLVSGLVAWAYSAPPLRLKMRPGLDLLTHALFVQTFPYVVSLVLIRARWGLLDWVLLAILFLASLTAQLEQQARDFVVDVAGGWYLHHLAGAGSNSKFELEPKLSGFPLTRFFRHDALTSRPHEGAAHPVRGIYLGFFQFWGVPPPKLKKPL
jgi:hypothetical protein